MKAGAEESVLATAREVLRTEARAIEALVALERQSTALRHALLSP